MTTIIERNSDSGIGGVVAVLLVILLVAGGVWFAYSQGAFGPTTVIENHKTVVMPAPAAPAPAPAPAAAPDKPSN